LSKGSVGHRHPPPPCGLAGLNHAGRGAPYLGEPAGDAAVARAHAHARALN